MKTLEILQAAARGNEIGWGGLARADAHAAVGAGLVSYGTSPRLTLTAAGRQTLASLLKELAYQTGPQALGVQP